MRLAIFSLLTFPMAIFCSEMSCYAQQDASNFSVVDAIQGVEWQAANGKTFQGLVASTNSKSVVVLKRDDLSQWRIDRKTLNKEQLQHVAKFEAKLAYLKSPLDLRHKKKDVDYDVVTIESVAGSPEYRQTNCKTSETSVRIRGETKNGLLYCAGELPSGLHLTFYPTKEVHFLNYLDGSEVVLSLHLFRDGTISTVIPYVAEKAQGPVIEYYPSGKIYGISNFDRGIQHGRSVTFGPNGEVYEVSEWKAGRMVSDEVLSNNRQDMFAIQRYLKEECMAPSMFYDLWDQAMRK